MYLTREVRVKEAVLLNRSHCDRKYPSNGRVTCISKLASDSCGVLYIPSGNHTVIIRKRILLPKEVISTVYGPFHMLQLFSQ